MYYWFIWQLNLFFWLWWFSFELKPIFDIAIASKVVKSDLINYHLDSLVYIRDTLCSAHNMMIFLTGYFYYVCVSSKNKHSQIEKSKTRVTDEWKFHITWPVTRWKYIKLKLMCLAEWNSHSIFWLNATSITWSYLHFSKLLQIFDVSLSRMEMFEHVFLDVRQLHQWTRFVPESLDD